MIFHPDIDASRLLETLLTENPNIAGIVFDKNYRYLLISGQPIERLPFDIKEGQSMYDLPDAVRNSIKPLYDRALAGEHFETEYRSVTNTHRYYQLNFVPLKDTNGSVFAGMCLIMDVSKLVFALEKVKTLQDAKKRSRLTAELSREMTKHLMQFYDALENLDPLEAFILKKVADKIKQYISDMEIINGLFTLMPEPMSFTEIVVEAYGKTQWQECNLEPCQIEKANPQLLVNAIQTLISHMSGRKTLNLVQKDSLITLKVTATKLLQINEIQWERSKAIFKAHNISLEVKHVEKLVIVTLQLING